MYLLRSESAAGQNKAGGSSGLMPRPEKTELTPADWAVVQHLADGWTLEDLAKELGTTYGCIKNRLSGMYDVAGVWTRPELVARGFRLGKLK